MTAASLGSEGTITPLVPQALEVVVGLGVLVVVVVLAGLALLDAHARGRSVALWLLVFLLTGPLGVAAYYLARTGTPATTR